MQDPDLATAAPISGPSRSDPQAAIAQGYLRLASARTDTDRVEATAVLVLAIFDDFYLHLCEYPYRAKDAFERRDLHASIQISRQRLELYSRYVAEHGPRIRAAFPALPLDTELWDAFDARFLAMITDRYEADIAFSFAHSIRRNVCQGLWRPVAYSFPPPSKRRQFSMASVYRRMPVPAQGVDVDFLCAALRIPGFAVEFRDLRGDAARILERVQRLSREESWGAWPPRALDVVEAGFFRDRTAFLVARWVLADGSFLPLVIAFLNGPDGIRVDALLHRTADVHTLFSSTLANFHVTTRLYYQTCVFLFSVMPLRPLGHQYSTIGFNHVGKVAILDEIAAQMRRSGAKFQHSPGAPGTVAIGFTFDACSYHLKIIRDRPTAAYKWGAYPGAAAVVEKYRAVHEINRAGSMLDNVMYFNLHLDREMFDPLLLAEIVQEASGSVQIEGESVFMRSLIVQMKIIPLPVFLDDATEEETRAVIVSLGKCIRNNAATNIFNKDLDSRNYGVGRYGQVYLFDYDAVEKLADVKVRTNLDREPGEDSPPAWFFEDGVIFLPEELDVGMRLKSDFARRSFRQENADLLTTQYWEAIQELLRRGEVPELSVYPESCKLN
jgi:isocitrate dehydrogenase kinase/phosphatase